MNVNHSVTSNSLWPYGLYSPLSSPGQNTGVGSSSLLQGIFPTQGSNPGLPHCRQILYQLNYQGSPRILEWVVYPFSRGSFWPRNQTRVSCIAGRFFTNWATRKALTVILGHPLIDTIKGNSNQPVFNPNLFYSANSTNYSDYKFTEWLIQKGPLGSFIPFFSFYKKKLNPRKKTSFSTVAQPLIRTARFRTTPPD